MRRVVHGLLSSVSLLAVVAAQGPSPQLRLFGQMSGTRTYLVDTNGKIVHTWNSSRPPGLGVYLLDDGTLLRTINTGLLPGAGGGTGGGVQMQALDSTLLWDFRYSGNGVWSHHDIEPLPNGNFLMIAWEDRTPAQAIAAGRNPSWVSSVFRPDHVVEVRPSGPTTGTIVWEWHVFDHLVQEFDATKANYGVVSDHPELIDVNYPPAGISSDWNHCNGVDYDAVHDWIILSSRYFSEVWIIDHSTTTAEAAGHTGGSYGVGGDLLYRWGNPAAYKRGTAANQKLFNQHSANVIPPGYPGAGNILLFNNNLPGGSAAQEFVLPLDGSGRFVLNPGQAYGPAGVIWSYSGGFSSGTMSSARRAPNGNTLICSATQGRILEVNPANQVVWSYNLSGGCFHAHYLDHYLWTSRDSLSTASGGTVSFDLIAGSEHAGRTYLLLGSAAGTSPGVTFNGQLLPLNIDPYFMLTATMPNLPPFSQTLGNLNELGRASASFTLPPGLTALAGLHLDHAFVAIDPTAATVTKASNAMPLDLLQ